MFPSNVLQYFKITYKNIFITLAHFITAFMLAVGTEFYMDGLILEK